MPTVNNGGPLFLFRAFVMFPLDSEGHVCRMHGRRVRNVQDDRRKLAQKFAHQSHPAAHSRCPAL
jgi:hypothetical protein